MATDQDRALVAVARATALVAKARARLDETLELQTEAMEVALEVGVYARDVAEAARMSRGSVYKRIQQ